MDDMKRAIYLEVLKKLEKPHKEIYICNELCASLINIYGVKYFNGIIDEFFPEFYALFDGYAYDVEDRYTIYKNEPWFSCENKRARITLINFLLSNR